MDACGDRDASESVMDRVVGQQEARILLIYRKREVSRVPDGSLLGGRLRCCGQALLNGIKRKNTTTCYLRDKVVVFLCRAVTGSPSLKKAL
ncbi:MAG: hypothetical protein SOR58_04005 [Megasphaera massiliensis]|uniref:hypothetical protein n=1 Tax=Megasphaera massiliensis TaxID=1232428 RepID=UPI002A753A32|nr:hypothetical protein [Megasphaera massiliensis]MDY2965347.1 hypothetical protein [Megasphaera massiliensis]